MEPVFYASCVANLTFRFDETLEVSTVADAPRESSAVGSTPSTGVSGAEAPAEVEQEDEPGDPRAGDEVRDVSSRTEPIFDPLVFPRDDSLTHIMARIPISATWELPGLRQAGRFSLQFDFRDAPIDPRVVRGIGVQIHAGTVSAEDYGRGIAGKTSAQGQRLSILQQKKTDLLLNEGTLILSGIADTMHVVHGERKSTLSITGRDTLGILLDAKIPAEKIAEVDLSKPLDDVITDILATLPTDDRFEIDVSEDDSEWPNGTLPSPGDVEGLMRVRTGADGKGAKSTPPGGSDLSYWDLITRYSAMVGATPHLVGTVLWLRPAHSIYRRVPDDSILTPFRGAEPRQVGRESLRVRRLVYGRDLKSVEYERKYTGQNVPIVQVFSIDDRKRGEEKLLDKQWPPEGSKAAKLKGDGERHRVPAPGVVDEERLEQLARELYEEIGRGEMGGKASTKNLASFGGDNSDADMIRLRPTDAVELAIDARALSSRAPLVSELNRHEQRSLEEEVKELTERIGDPVFARVLASVSRGAIAGQLNFFRVNNVRGSWDINSGIQIDFDFQDYITARHDEKAETDAEATETRKVKTKRVKRSAKNNKRPSLGGALRSGVEASRALVAGAESRGRAVMRQRMRRSLEGVGVSEGEIDRILKENFR